MAKVIVLGEVLKWFTVFLCLCLFVVSIFGLISLNSAVNVNYDTNDGIGIDGGNAAYTICVLCVYLMSAQESPFSLAHTRSLLHRARGLFTGWECAFFSNFFFA
jgi:hypothetical protein